MTVFGPTSANYDEALPPTLFTDFLHRSAFEEFYKEFSDGLDRPYGVGVLLNGTGKCFDTFFRVERLLNIEKAVPIPRKTVLKKGLFAKTLASCITQS